MAESCVLAQAAGVEDAWQPPAGASIGVAAVCLHMALVSTAPNRSLIAVQVIHVSCCCSAVPNVVQMFLCKQAPVRMCYSKQRAADFSLHLCA